MSQYSGFPSPWSFMIYDFLSFSNRLLNLDFKIWFKIMSDRFFKLLIINNCSSFIQKVPAMMRLSLNLPEIFEHEFANWYTVFMSRLRWKLLSLDDLEGEMMLHGALGECRQAVLSLTLTFLGEIPLRMSSVDLVVCYRHLSLLCLNLPFKPSRKG